MYPQLVYTDLNGLFCNMSSSSSVEPPAHFPYTNAIGFPQCPRTVLNGVEGVIPNPDD